MLEICFVYFVNRIGGGELVPRDRFDQMCASEGGRAELQRRLDAGEAWFYDATQAKACADARAAVAESRRAELYRQIEATLRELKLEAGTHAAVTS